MIVALAVATLLAFVSALVATLTGLLGNEAHAWAPHFARKLIRRSARWLHPSERRDYEDENLDIIDCYVVDGRNLAAVAVGATELCRHVATLAAPRWIEDGLGARVALILGGLAAILVIPRTPDPTGSASFALAMVLMMDIGEGIERESGVRPLRGVMRGIGIGLLVGLHGGIAGGLALGGIAGLASIAHGVGLARAATQQRSQGFQDAIDLAGARTRPERALPRAAVLGGTTARRTFIAHPPMSDATVESVDPSHLA